MPQDTNTFADKPDQELVIRAKAGDSAAFEELFVRHIGELNLYLLQITRNHLDLIKMQHEMIYGAWKNISTISVV